MNKKSLFRKTGKFASVTAGLSSALFPAFTVKAEDFEVSEDKEINDAFNKDRLSYVYCVFRFDFVKNYILSEVTKELVTRNVETIEELLKQKKYFDFVSDKVKIRYIFNFQKNLNKSPGNEIEIFSNFKEQDKTANKTGSVEFGCDEYEKSKKAIELIEKTSFYCDFFNYLIQKFGESSLNKSDESVKSFLFSFNSSIDLGDKGGCLSLAFNFYKDKPSLVIKCLKGSKFKGKGGKIFVGGGAVFNYSCEADKDSVYFKFMSLEEMKSILLNIKDKIEKDNVGLKVYTKEDFKKASDIIGGKQLDFEG